MLLPLPALASVDTILSDAAAICAEQDNGVFPAEAAVRSLDVTGDGQPDTQVDGALFTCTTAASP